MTYFQAFLLLCVLTLLACVGEHPEHNVPTEYPDAGPVACGLTELKCEFADPVARTGWHCYWVDLCPSDEDGGI